MAEHIHRRGRGRGRGVGRQLLERAMAFNDTHGYTRCYLWTFQGLGAAKALYESYGFRLAHEQPGVPGGGLPVDGAGIVARKELTQRVELGPLPRVPFDLQSLAAAVGVEADRGTLIGRLEGDRLVPYPDRGAIDFEGGLLSQPEVLGYVDGASSPERMMQVAYLFFFSDLLD